MDLQQILAQLGVAGINPAAIFAQLQAFLSGDIKSKQAGMATEYDQAIKAIQEYYGTAEEQRGEVYNDSVREIAENAGNLGINFQQGDLAKQWDADSRYMQETADLALANDLSYFEKLKTSNQDMYNALLVDLATSQLNMIPKGGSGGGGGGGRGRGGGGGSSDWNFDPETGAPLGTIQETQDVSSNTDFFNPLMQEALQSGQAFEDPELAAKAERYLRLAGSGNSTAALQNVQKDYDIAAAVPKARMKRSPNWNPFNNEVETGEEGELVNNNLIGNIGKYVKDAVPRMKADNDMEDMTSLMDFFQNFNANWTPTVTSEKMKQGSTFDGNKRKNQPMPGYGVQSDAPVGPIRRQGLQSDAPVESFRNPAAALKKGRIGASGVNLASLGKGIGGRTTAAPTNHDLPELTVQESGMIDNGLVNNALDAERSLMQAVAQKKREQDNLKLMAAKVASEALRKNKSRQKFINPEPQQQQPSRIPNLRPRPKRTTTGNSKSSNRAV